MNLNVFSSSKSTRYGISEALTFDSIEHTFDEDTVTWDMSSADTDVFESDGGFSGNTFSSNSTTRYEVSESEGVFDASFDITFG